MGCGRLENGYLPYSHVSLAGHRQLPEELALLVKAQGGINATAFRRIRQAVANNHGIGHGFGRELEVLAGGGEPDAFSAGGFPFNGVGVGSGSRQVPVLAMSSAS